MSRLPEPVPCMTCGDPTDHVCRVCEACITARAIATRRTQGLPDEITRPSTIARFNRALAALADREQAAS